MSPECMELLSTAKIGRLVYNSRYGPVAVPSEYKIHEGSIVFPHLPDHLHRGGLGVPVSRMPSTRSLWRSTRLIPKRGRGGW